MFAVICIHAPPFLKMEDYRILGCLVQNLARFAVPFFLATSGYFFGMAVRKGAPVLPLLGRYLKRLLMVFAGWSVIYGVLPNGILKTFYRGGWVGGWDAIQAQGVKTVTYITSYPLKFLLVGTKFHLWFFVALMMGLVIVGALILIKKQKYILPVAAVLFLAGFLMVNQTPFHVKLYETISDGGGPFYAPLFLSLGWWCSGLKRPPELWIAATLIVTGVILRMTEMFVFWDFLGDKSFLPRAYTLGTVPLGMGFFLLALARPQLGASTVLPKLGALTLGIYASHILIQFNLPYGMMKHALGPVAATILRPFVIFFLAAVLAWLLRRFRFTRFLAA